MEKTIFKGLGSGKYILRSAMLMGCVMILYSSVFELINTDEGTVYETEAASPDMTPLMEKMLACAVSAAMPQANLTAKTALAALLLNRCEQPIFPDTLPDVIICSVSGVSYSNQPDSVSVSAAKAALMGIDPSNGAIYWEEKTDSSPSFASVIDGYCFYK